MHYLQSPSGQRLDPLPFRGGQTPLMPTRRPLLDASLSWTEDAIAALYRVVSVDPDRFLAQLRERGLRAGSITDLRQLDPAVREGLAGDLIRTARRTSAISGVGFGFGGWAAVAPEIVGQLVLIVQLGQRLSLLHGVDYRSPAGEIELWKAMAEGTGARVDLQGTPRQAAWRLPVVMGHNRFALGPLAGKIALAVVRRLLTGLSTPLGRMVPVVGSGVGLVANYTVMARVGRRMMAYYRRRHGPMGGAHPVVAEADVVRAARR